MNKFWNLKENTCIKSTGLSSRETFFLTLFCPALVHTNFFVDYPRLVAPNTKYVGGMHVREPAPLPKRYFVRF